jgi:hypothetical protein
MQYVLGNMLNGGGINPDGLSLDLQFAADKTFSKPSSLAAGETAITSRRGPSATFLRSTAATEVGPDGLIRYAPENLVIGSSAAAFSAANATRGTSTILGIDGVALTSCTSLNANGNRVGTSLITIAPNQIYTLSAYMAAGTSSFGGLVADNFPTGVGAIFNLTGSGSVVSSAAVSGTVISTSIQRIGTTELYRCSITFSFTSITSAAVGFGVSNGSTYAFSIFPSASSGTVNAGAIQLERHPTARTYIPTTTAAVYAPRFDHDPVTLACKGLLIEEGRTNLFSSTNLNDWATSRCTKTPITGIGLTNQATTLTISETGSIYIFRGATLTTGVAYAISVRVKAGTVASFGFADLTDGKYSRGFNLSTNQWAASGGAPEFTNYTVTPNVDGWFLVSAIYTPTGATGGKNIAFLFGSSVVGQTVSFDTPQLEAGAFPTSFIPTTTGTLARSADVCSITGSDFNNFYNQSEGTMLANSSCFAPQPIALPSRRVVAATDGTITNRVSISNVAAGFITPGLSQAFVVFAGGSLQSDLGIAGLTLSSLNKTAGAYKENDIAASTNGSEVVTDASASVPTNLNRLEIGNQISGDFLCGHIAAIRYFKKRLPNAKIQALTV